MGTPGVFKLNIALPNGGAVTLECADRELVRELLYSALPQLSGTPAAATPSPTPGPIPGDLIPGADAPAHHSNGNGVSNGSVNGNGAYHEPMPAAPTPPPMPAPTPTPPPAGYAPAPAAAYPPAANGRETDPAYNPADAAPAYRPSEVQQFADAAAPALSPTPAIPEMQHGAGIPNGNGVPSHGIPANGHAYPVSGNGNGSGNGHSPHYHAYPANGSSNANPPPAAPVPDAAPPTSTPTPTPAVEPATLDENDFVAFCHQVSPLGDMRRVVVAAEAADRYLGIASVDPDELARLFRLAGWPLPHNFVQTLRNAARSKFRWLERITGQSGHYRVTDTGRSIVLGEGKGTLTALTPTAIPSQAPAPALAGVAG